MTACSSLRTGSRASWLVGSFWGEHLDSELHNGSKTVKIRPSSHLGHSPAYCGSTDTRLSVFLPVLSKHLRANHTNLRQRNTTNLATRDLVLLSSRTRCVGGRVAAVGRPRGECPTSPHPPDLSPTPPGPRRAAQSNCKRCGGYCDSSSTSRRRCP